eukprot:2598836-Pyramimonas_sp.AAC.1
MILEVTGDCTGNVNQRDEQLRNAKNYAKITTEKKADRLLLQDGVDPDYWPTERQITNQRAKNKVPINHYVAECL